MSIWVGAPPFGVGLVRAEGWLVGGAAVLLVGACLGCWSCFARLLCFSFCSYCSDWVVEDLVSFNVVWFQNPPLHHIMNAPSKLKTINKVKKEKRVSLTSL
jgi:hypothetical protein